MPKDKKRSSEMKRSVVDSNQVGSKRSSEKPSAGDSKLPEVQIETSGEGRKMSRERAPIRKKRVAVRMFPSDEYDAAPEMPVMDKSIMPTEDEGRMFQAMDQGGDVEDVLDRTLKTLELYTRSIESLNVEVSVWKVRFGVLLTDVRACYNMLPRDNRALRTRMISILKMVGAPFWKSAEMLGEAELKVRVLRRRMDVMERLRCRNETQIKRELRRLCCLAHEQDLKVAELESQLAKSERDGAARETRSVAQRTECTREADVQMVQLRAEFNVLKEDNMTLRANNEDMADKVRIMEERVAVLTDTFSCHVHPVAITAAIDAIHAGSSANDADGTNAFPAMVTAESLAWIKGRGEKRRSEEGGAAVERPPRRPLAPGRHLQSVGPSYYALEPGPPFVVSSVRANNSVPSVAQAASYAERMAQGFFADPA